MQSINFAAELMLAYLRENSEISAACFLRESFFKKTKCFYSLMFFKAFILYTKKHDNFKALNYQSNIFIENRLS